MDQGFPRKVSRIPRASIALLKWSEVFANHELIDPGCHVQNRLFRNLVEYGGPAAIKRAESPFGILCKAGGVVRLRSLAIWSDHL